MMRMPYLLFALLSFFLATQPASAAEAAEKPVVNEEEVMPDAMARLMKAPNIDFTNIRDPFLSSFAKNRIEEAQRFKSLERLPANKRKREVLEQYDLSTLTLVGTFKKAAQDWVASVQDATGKSYTVRRGAYIGKRSGRVEKIDGQTIYLVEQIINPAGEVVDHQVTLTLAEVND